ncbi:type IV pilin [Halococcoides cellulosivorans]|uniref:Type IV pilin n=1 Tax=Halococcoides cellulosivorans TaxID=1679096 RepID=A0A2R4WYX7_9EURY|nr:type IV pilin N-terminal domain-containing protein [Halococcoides cellulosivorans]AWB26748.1 type IV pilin [Halococcoides cellulosivorans]
MHIPPPFEDARAASPVIGVIFAVALTLVVALAGATFVLSTTDATADSVTLGPEASFDIDWDGDPTSSGAVTITHTGGEAVPGDRLVVRGTSGDGTTAVETVWRDSGTVSPGDTYTVPDVGATDHLRLVWTSPDSDRTVVYASWTGPHA